MSDVVLKNVEELREYSNKYDAVIVGSDQVWNPYWQGSLDEFFLTFVPKSKRVAYAPSIGVSEIPNEQKAALRKDLMDFQDYLAERIRDANLLKNLQEKNANTCAIRFSYCLLSNGKAKSARFRKSIS